jgi:Flp pilus assembly pilin Flp
MMRRLREFCRREDGMTTAEYAVGLIAAVAFAGVNVAHRWYRR